MLMPQSVSILVVQTAVTMLKLMQPLKQWERQLAATRFVQKAAEAIRMLPVLSQLHHHLAWMCL